MPIQNVIQHAPLDGGMTLTNMQNNRQTFRYGNMATSERMYASRDHVSPFGNETHIGRGQMSRENRETMEVSVESIAKIMEQDDEFEGSKTGSYSALGPTEFQEFNDRSFRNHQQIVANAYKYFTNYGV